MADKQSFELKQGVNRVTITRADGSSLVMEGEGVRDVTDADDIRELEIHPDVKVAEKKGKNS